MNQLANRDVGEARNNGGGICRIAAYCTEADVSIQHFGLAGKSGLETVGFLMSHTIPPEKLAAQAGSSPTPAADTPISSTTEHRRST